MLAGKPMKAADEILAQLEAVVRNGAKAPTYTVGAPIRINGSVWPQPKRKFRLLCPLFETVSSRCT
jgi:hypothetical protein